MARPRKDGFKPLYPNDPHDLAELYEELADVLSLLEIGKAKDAIKVLRSIIKAGLASPRARGCMQPGCTRRAIRGNRFCKEHRD